MKTANASRSPKKANDAAKVAARLNKLLAKQQQAAADLPFRLQVLVEQHEAKKAHAKALYAECDRIEEEIHGLIGMEQPIVLPDGRTAKIKDNFRDAAGQPKKTHYKPAGVSLWELSVK